MAKFVISSFALISIVVVYCNATAVNVPNLNDPITFLNQNIKEYENEYLNWEDHVLDFVKLIKLEKLMSTALSFIDDPEVMRFIGFILSPKFKDMVWEFESMDEFKEAYTYLLTKGYDLQPVIDYVNAGLSLPQFNKPPMVLRHNIGVSGFLAAMIGSLPIEDMRELLNEKVENYSEVAEFLNIIKSPEFKDILKRMHTSTKFAEFKTIFESYGVDFSFVCKLLEEIAGDDYQGFICDNNKETVYVI